LRAKISQPRPLFKRRAWIEWLVINIARPRKAPQNQQTHDCAGSQQLVSSKQVNPMLTLHTFISRKTMASLEFLDGDHLYPLHRALTNCLATLVAEHTYAQILDGQPTCSVYAGDHHFEEDWPVMQHKEICPGFLEKAKAFRSDFSIMSLKFNVKARLTRTLH